MWFGLQKLKKKSFNSLWSCSYNFKSLHFLQIYVINLQNQRLTGENINFSSGPSLLRQQIQKEKCLFYLFEITYFQILPAQLNSKLPLSTDLSCPVFFNNIHLWFVKEALKLSQQFKKISYFALLQSRCNCSSIIRFMCF